MEQGMRKAMVNGEEGIGDLVFVVSFSDFPFLFSDLSLDFGIWFLEFHFGIWNLFIGFFLLGFRYWALEFLYLNYPFSGFVFLFSDFSLLFLPLCRAFTDSWPGLVRDCFEAPSQIVEEESNKGRTRDEERSDKEQ